MGRSHRHRNTDEAQENSIDAIPMKFNSTNELMRPDMTANNESILNGVLVDERESSCDSLLMKQERMQSRLDKKRQQMNQRIRLR